MHSVARVIKKLIQTGAGTQHRRDCGLFRRVIDDDQMSILVYRTTLETRVSPVQSVVHHAVATAVERGEISEVSRTICTV